MRAKFIRGQDPKDALGIGVFGEIIQGGYYGDDNYNTTPVAVSDTDMVLLLNNWMESIDDDYVFRVKDKAGEVVHMDPDDMEGKSFIYKGAIYNIPKS